MPTSLSGGNDYPANDYHLLACASWQTNIDELVAARWQVRVEAAPGDSGKNTRHDLMVGISTVVTCRPPVSDFGRQHPNGGRVTVSRLQALSLALLLAACSASSTSSKKPASADSEFKSWGSDSSKSSSKDDEEESESKDLKKEKTAEGPSCLDQKGDVMECLHDSDCCRGFYCGIDPTGSPRIKVCLYGGK